MSLKNPVTAKDHCQGPETAPIILVEYGDYQCPYCREAYYLLKEVQKNLKNDLRFVFRNFPLTEVHPFAELAAEAAEFAADHGRFWQMHDALYENQQKFSVPFFLELGNSLGLPLKDLEKTLQENPYEEKIKADFMGGVRSGVNGTPTFFINNQRYNGPPELNHLVASLRAAAGNR